MVMVVGNRVVGDSRVEKTARTAQEAGFRLTVVGLKHRTVPTFGLIGEIPIYRVSPDNVMYRAWSSGRSEDDIALQVAAKEARQRLSRRRGKGHHGIMSWVSRAAARRLDSGGTALRTTAMRLRLSASWLLARSRLPGTWRRAWPQIADFELAFAETILALEPDIVHVHDRHAMPAADTASAVFRRIGRPLPWVYDAHEWLPGVVFTGPAVHGAAWRAAEAELIKNADAVITVADERADRLKDSHRLPVRPKVVVNAPRAARAEEPSPGRAPLREECRLSPETPLLVYVGRVARQRGVSTVIESLTRLDGVHLAVVAPDSKPRAELVELAKMLGVDDRFHVADYVPANDVTWYISSASAGVSPLEHNSAHHQDVPTKVREYLHAGLPVISSDARAQAKLIGDAGVGSIHRAGDAVDCARAIDEVLTKLDAFRAAITPELLADNSWEAQEEALTSVWHELAGVPTPATPVAAHPRFVIGPAVDLIRSTRMVDAICEYTGGSGEVVTKLRDPGHSSNYTLAEAGAPLSLKIEEFRRLVAEVDALILEALVPMFGGLFGSVEDQSKQLAKMRPIAMLLDPIALVDPDEAISLNPDSWLSTLDDAARLKITHQGRRTRRLISEMGARVFTTSAAWIGRDIEALWIPAVVPAREPTPRGDGTVRVLLNPAPRGGADRDVPRLLGELDGNGIEVVSAPSKDSLADLLATTDIFVDSLGGDGYSDLAAEAMAAGCAVISRLDPDTRAFLPHACPVIDGAPRDVTETVVNVASDRAALRQIGEEGRVYAGAVHDGRLSARVVAETFGWKAASADVDRTTITSR